MQVFDTTLSDVKILQPRRLGDDRGWFAEFYNEEQFAGAGLPTRFVQDNQSRSCRGVLRGLHYQLGKPQGKLVRVLSGEIWDVVVDLRRSSPTFGRYESFPLTPVNAVGELQLLWIPEGLAHGFLVLSETAEVLYKTTDFYHPAGERAIAWNDSTLAIPWPLDGITLSVSAKDAKARSFKEAELP